MRKLKTNLLSKAQPYNPRKLENANNYYYDDANGDDVYNGYGFDLSAYSLKYASCSTVSTFSDDLAEDEDSSTIFYKQQFVVFRLCPSDTCVSSGSNGSGEKDGFTESVTSAFTGSNMESYGCMNDYGEYMLPLYDWLDVIGEYREEEFERYCGYCDACVGGYYADGDEEEEEEEGDDKDYYENRGDKYYNQGDLDDDGAAADDADAAGDDGAVDADDGAADEADADDGAANEADDQGRRRKLDQNNNDDNYDCSYESACSGYGEICYDEDRVDWSQFFGCKQMQVNDDTSVYMGPHCKNDKSTIIFSAFEDEDCQIYIGDKYDLSTITDDLIKTDSLEEYFRSDCISCKESDLPFQQADDDAEDNDDISEICENLYGYAAKCNRHIGSATENSYQSHQQADNEYAVCSYISSVVTGSYDEYGYIYIDSSDYSSDNKYNAYAKSAIRKDVVTGSQALSLVFFSVVLLIVTVKAALVRFEVEQKLGFSPSSREPLGKQDFRRQDSGIMMCRSKSNIDTSYQAPLHGNKLV